MAFTEVDRVEATVAQVTEEGAPPTPPEPTPLPIEQTMGMMIMVMMMGMVMGQMEEV